MDTTTIAQLNNDATTRREDGTTIVTIGGVDVHVRVNSAGKPYVWVEMDESDAPLINADTECLPVVLGIAETTIFETDDRGLGADSGIFPTI